jgi:hypothetical protein
MSWGSTVVRQRFVFCREFPKKAKGWRRYVRKAKAFDRNGHHLIRGARAPDGPRKGASPSVPAGGSQRHDRVHGTQRAHLFSGTVTESGLSNGVASRE